MVNNYVGSIDAYVSAGSIAAYNMPFSDFLKGKMQRIKDCVFGGNNPSNEGSLDAMIRKIAKAPINGSVQSEYLLTENKQAAVGDKLYTSRDVDGARSKSVSDIVNGERGRVAKEISDIYKNEVDNYNKQESQTKKSILGRLCKKVGDDVQWYLGIEETPVSFRAPGFSEPPTAYGRLTKKIRNEVENFLGIEETPNFLKTEYVPREVPDVANMNKEELMNLYKSGDYTYNEIQSAVDHVLSQKINAEMKKNLDRIHLKDISNLYSSLHRGN
ncbi:MAG: hypothetical protein KJ583_02890 [Nanoarchaeota archaeon]|nr:hypothetical protein [Nanoarchaeota archaeon]MBU1270041.1 hypothetical protein [Nanoarchaeota archaeon]MBU1604241.1 hypothetical protein [Nanoarchaeota archaeon]MBU2443777.1 hypothetical protein [Nanoarchaeota archaeon]